MISNNKYFLGILSSNWLPNPKNIITKALGTILSAFEDINQMEVIKVRWEEIKRLQVQPVVVS